MQLNPSEISELIKSRIQGLGDSDVSHDNSFKVKVNSKFLQRKNGPTHYNNLNALHAPDRYTPVSAS